MEPDNGENGIKELIEKCEQELALTQDSKVKLEGRMRIQDLWKKYRGEDEVISSEDFLKMVAEERTKERFKAFTRIPKLDSIIEGFRDGNLIVISGSTKMGKTSFAQTLTENFSEDGINCLWFTYEVPMFEFVEKFKTIPRFYLPKALTGDTVEWLEKKIIEGIAKYDTKVIFIDHLHYIVDLKSLKTNLSIQIGTTMRDLKKIALRWGVIIFLIAHIKKTKITELPELDDLRDSSFVAQEADIVMMVSRLKEESGNEYSNEAIVSVLAHRRTGKMGVIRLIYRENKFYEVSHAYGG